MLSQIFCNLLIRRPDRGFSRTFPSLLLSFPSRRLLLFWYGSYQSMRLRIVVCFVSPFSYFILTRRHTLLMLESVRLSVVRSTFPYFQEILWIIRYFLFSWPVFPLVWWQKKRSMIFFQFCCILKTTFLSLMKNSESAKKSCENNIRIWRIIHAAEILYILYSTFCISYFDS